MNLPGALTAIIAGIAAFGLRPIRRFPEHDRHPVLFLTLYLQDLLGYRAITTGLALLPNGLIVRDRRRRRAQTACLERSPNDGDHVQHIACTWTQPTRRTRLRLGSRHATTLSSVQSLIIFGPQMRAWNYKQGVKCGT